MAITQANLDTLYANALGGSMVAASGTITIAAGNAAENDTVTVNGAVYTFTATPSETRDVEIGANNNGSAANLHAKLAAATGAAVSAAAYTVADNVITVTFKVPGTIGNDFTLAKVGANITVSGATLANGADTGATDFASTDANGFVVPLRQDSAFEKNLLSLVGVIDAVLGTSVDSSANPALARRQRRALKLVLEYASAQMPVVADMNADDRAVVRQRVRDEVLKRYSGINQPLGGL